MRLNQHLPRRSRGEQIIQDDRLLDEAETPLVFFYSEGGDERQHYVVLFAGPVLENSDTIAQTDVRSFVNYVRLVIEFDLE